MALFKKYLEKGVESAQNTEVKKVDSDEKKIKRQAKNAEQRKKIGKWCRELKSEFKKIVWPTKAQTTKNTLVVIVVIAVVAAIVALLDLVFEQGVLQLLLKLAAG